MGLKISVPQRQLNIIDCVRAFVFGSDPLFLIERDREPADRGSDTGAHTQTIRHSEGLGVVIFCILNIKYIGNIMSFIVAIKKLLGFTQKSIN